MEVSHSRIRRYEILLEFVKTKPEISVKEVVQKMILDLYLRENLKSRPGFAPSQKEFEKAIWEFRRQNSIPKTAHIEVFENGSACLFDYENRDALSGNAYVSNVVLK
ncbi:MAG: DUF4080 domain-containing protein [Blautia sp.]|nr:DUF4080 domain-containing protein [Blautia sp.]